MSAIAGTEAEHSETGISFVAEVVTDPVGVDLTVMVGEEAPRPTQQALLANIRDTVVDRRGNLVFQSVRVANGALRSWGQRHGFEVEPVTESVQVLTVDEMGQTLRVRWGWLHEATKYFQFGVSPHTIDGRPLLSFIWEDAPDSVRELFPHTERVDGDPRVFLPSVDHPGMPESRFVNAGINWLRQEVR